MPELAELQRLFWRALDGRGPDPALLDVIVPAPPLDAQRRLGIYAGMYVARIIEAVEEDYPRLAALAGEEGFAAIVRAYLAEHPSTSPSIGRIGAALPAFLAAGAVPTLPACAADLARLEWARREVFEAPDAEPLTLASLQGVRADDWPSLRFALVPGCTILVTAWPVHQLWEADAGQAPALAPARTALRVWRDGFLVYHAPMGSTEEAALGCLAAGEPWASLCEGFESPEDAAGLLLRWIEDGIVAAPG